MREIPQGCWITVDSIKANESFAFQKLKKEIHRILMVTRHPHAAMLASRVAFWPKISEFLCSSFLHKNLHRTQPGQLLPSGFNASWPKSNTVDLNDPIFTYISCIFTLRACIGWPGMSDAQCQIGFESGKACIQESFQYNYNQSLREKHVYRKKSR